MKTVSLLRRLCCVALLTALAAPCSSHAQSVYSVVETLGDPSSGLTAQPATVALDTGGNVYIADTNNNRVQVFNSLGAYQWKFGFAGSGIGQLNKPAGIALDKSNNVYVADTGNNRIEKFDSNGNYLAQFGAMGSGAGQFSSPGGIATDTAGNVYVADTGNNRIEKFDKTGAYVSQFGGAGAGNGQFNKPLGLIVDKIGNIYVADSGNNRIGKFNSSGVFQLGIGAGYNGVTGNVGSSGSGSGQFNAPSGVAVDGATSPNIYVADTGNNRAQKFTGAGVFSAPVGTGTMGSGNGQCVAPFGIGVFIASATNPTIYIVDTGNNRVQKFDKTGAFVTPPTGSVNPFGNAGYANGQLGGPQGIALDSSGNVFVANYNANNISEFNNLGLGVPGFGSTGASNGQFSGPVGLAIDIYDNIFVADYNNLRTQRFDDSGNYITQFGYYTFFGPGNWCGAGVKVDSTDKVY